MKYSRPRGTQDILPPDIHVWRYVEGVFDATFERYGYEPVRTPIFESTDVFLRSVGEATDIVSKEMYTFNDRGGRSITLRPENTAAVIRAFLENGFHRRGGITRWCYTGPMFRYDRPQAGRYRQFHQVGSEVIGSLSPLLDVETIDVVTTALEALGFTDLVVKLNSVGCAECRKSYTDILRSALAKLQDRLCEDCDERALKNPMRVFDCKRCEDVKAELPSISDHLCQGCAAHFDQVKSNLDAIGRTYEIDARLVRGLDYYTRTTFEILHGELGAQNALCGGGRYDDLVEQCGGPSTPAVGFSAGLERIISVLPDQGSSLASRGSDVDFYVICLDDASAPRALRAARVLRAFGRAELDASMRALKKQLRNAERRGARVSLLVGGDDPDRVIWKDMEKREQIEIEDDGLLAFAERFCEGDNG
ncbi:MAG: histidine--tRNA ligase [Candidatus Latescibacterota bacterium]|nr:MAG: histidine--tRNA ligase [Candidatus Latescibacterota bacterium]